MARPDYYAILGVLPSAEDVVIKAAYRALAQRYHPDKFKGDPALATAKMAELNEAYGVLSDAAKRKAYDAERGYSTKEDEGCFDEDPAEEPLSDDPLSQDWTLATTYYPDLEKIERRLARFSWRLAYSYKASLLSSQKFGTRLSYALALEKEFLRKYFGKDRRILALGRDLVLEGRRVAALEVNRNVRVLGENLSYSQMLKVLEDRGLIPIGYPAHTSSTPIDPAHKAKLREIERLGRALQRRTDVLVIGCVIFLIIVLLIFLSRL